MSNSLRLQRLFVRELGYDARQSGCKAWALSMRGLLFQPTKG